MRILIVGLSTLDAHVRNAPFLEPDEHAYLENYRLSPGGSAANLAFTLAQLGADTSLCTRLGSDFAGQFVRQSLQSQGVRLAGNCEDSLAATGFSIINVTDKGSISLLHHEGANNNLCPEDVFPSDIERNDVFHIGGAMSMRELDGEPLANLLKLARSRGKITSLHTSRNTDKKELLLEALPYLDFIFLNERESADITGALDIVARARWLHSRGVRRVVITLGAKGAFASNGQVSGFVPGMKVSVNDTTGCGDAFTAGFLDAAWVHKDIWYCTAWGNVLGACCAKTLGAQFPLVRGDLELLVS